MIETGAMNDNEIVVRQGLAKDDVVLLTPPADKTGIKTEMIPGLQADRRAGAGGDTAKSVTLPTPETHGAAAGRRRPRRAPRREAEGLSVTADPPSSRARRAASRARALLAHIALQRRHRGRGGRRTTSCARASRRSAFSSASRR